MPDDIGTQLQKALRLQTILTAVLYAVVVLSLILVGVDAAAKRADIARVGERNTSALCALRDDWQARSLAYKDFLIRNPNGLPDTSVDSVRAQITNLERAMAALSYLDCAAP